MFNTPTKYKASLNAVFAFALLINSGAFAFHHEKAKANIVDTAIAADNFTTLVAAIEAAGLTVNYSKVPRVFFI